MQAESLRALADRENNNTNTQHAYAAASAYSSIVQEIGNAKRAADEAKAAIDNIELKVSYVLWIVKLDFSKLTNADYYEYNFVVFCTEWSTKDKNGAGLLEIQWATDTCLASLGNCSTTAATQSDSCWITASKRNAIAKRC